MVEGRLLPELGQPEGSGHSGIGLSALCSLPHMFISKAEFQGSLESFPPLFTRAGCPFSLVGGLG